jgi:hypothetical protein
MTKEQYWEMIRLKFIVHGSYGITKHPSEDERNEMYKKYMGLRNLYRECKGVIYEESVVN